jgi:hypothetical protein
LYGKLFEQMYDGTLAENWKALITFQQMIILCDDSGIVDLTPSAISRRTGIPLEHIESGIETLESEDPYSRTPDENGRRIARLDDHRPWGWRIINHQKYKQMASYEDKKKADRMRIAAKREIKKLKPVAVCRNLSQDVADVAHTDTDTDTDTYKKKSKRTKKFIPPTEGEVQEYFVENGYTAELAKTAFLYYEDGEPPWHDSSGKPVRSWKQKMRGVWFKKDKARGNGNGTNRYKSRVDRNDAALEEARKKCGIKSGFDQAGQDNDCIDVISETSETRFIE